MPYDGRQENAFATIKELESVMLYRNKLEVTWLCMNYLLDVLFINQWKTCGIHWLLISNFDERWERTRFITCRVWIRFGKKLKSFAFFSHFSTLKKTYTDIIQGEYLGSCWPGDSCYLWIPRLSARRILVYRNTLSSDCCVAVIHNLCSMSKM